jgi:hypothetical protein
MSRAAGNSWRARIAVLAMLAPALALAACSSKDDEMAQKLAAAQEAADKAVAAQKAAEKAAAAVINIRPAPRPEPTVMADTPNENFDGDESEGGGDNDLPEGFSMNGGSGQTVAPDGMVIPGQGA